MASITLRKGDPFEAILIEMVEMSRAKGHDYAPEPDNTKGLLPTNFDEVAREVPLVDYTPVKVSYHFVAMFDGQCRGCDLPISKGSWVTRWSDDTVKHYDC